MARYFEKISYQQFQKDVGDNQTLYNTYFLPTRATKHSAGYDFKALYDFVLHPNERMKIPTGVKVCMEKDEVLMLFVRSSMGTKHGVRLLNSVGIIDSDYYNNKENEGHIYISIKNESNKDYVVKQSDGIAQAIFTKYLVVDEEEEIKRERTGGFGSTNR